MMMPIFWWKEENCRFCKEPFCGIKLVFVLDVLLNLFGPWTVNWFATVTRSLLLKTIHDCWLNLFLPKKLRSENSGKTLYRISEHLCSKIILQVLRGCLGAFRKDQWNCYCDLQVSLHQMCVMLWANGSLLLEKPVQLKREFSIWGPLFFVLETCVVFSFLWQRERNTGFRGSGLLPGEGLVELLLWSSGVPSPDARDAVG
jgi:hypothetical protein